METLSHEHHHEMSPEDFDTLRARLPSAAEETDQQIALEMKMMGPNKSRYISEESVQGETAVLVLIHGFGPTGDRIMTDAVKPMADIFPTAMSAGMAMMGSEHIQKSLNDLENIGDAESIIVVPMVSSKRNTLIYQWQYIFGLREEGAYLDVPRVSTEARVIMADPPAGHPLITQILLDHALEISSDPSNEVVIIVAHGPVHDEEYRAQLESLAKQAQRVQKLGGFASVQGMTLQDDAAADVRAGNVKKLREAIEEATGDGKEVLIVTDLLAARSIQWKIERDLDGLNYQFSEKGISMHPDFVTWYQENLMAAMGR